MSLTDVGTGLAIGVAVGGLFIVGCVAYAFRRVGRTRRELGPWSVVLALASYLSGLFLILYAASALGAASSDILARGRIVFFDLFVVFAQTAVLVLPLVILQLPISALFVLLPAVALALVKLGEVIFFPSVFALLACPVVLVLEFLALRVAWGTGRLRVMDEPLDEQNRHLNEAGGDNKDPWFRGPPELRARHAIEPYPQQRVASSAALASLSNNAVFGQIERGPTSVNAGVTTLVSARSLFIIFTIIESILLAMFSAGCSDIYLHILMGVYAFTHGLLSLGALAPATTFS